MGRFTRVLAGLLGRSAGLLPAGRRDWAEAALAEAGEVPAGAGRVAWLGGGLWLVAREVLMARVIPALAFAAGAAAMVWISWPGQSSDSGIPGSRLRIAGTVVLLAVLPQVVRRYAGPVRGGWLPRAMRVGGYAVVLALITAKAVMARDLSKLESRLGAYFAAAPGSWAVTSLILLLLVIAAYAAGLLILTSQRIRVARSCLPIGVGTGMVTAVVLYEFSPFGQPDHTPAWVAGWYGPASTLSWWLAALVVPLATGFAAARFSARDEQPGLLDPAGQGCVAGVCATMTAALLLTALTLVTIALFPRQVPVIKGPYTGICPTCASRSAVIPPGLRHEYWAASSVLGAGDGTGPALMLAPFVGAALGGVGALGGLGRWTASGSPGTSRRGDGPLRASRADREQVIDVLKAAFVQGRLTKEEFDARVGHAFTSHTSADLAALTADVHGRT